MSMLVGIVSKPEHCQPHATMLQNEGFRVQVLGAKGVSFPPSLGVLVVRMASSSHGAVEQARIYAAKHNIPLVMEDGVTGIRRAFIRLGHIKPDFAETVVELLSTTRNPAHFSEALLLPEGMGQDVNSFSMHAYKKWSEVHGEPASGRFFEIFEAVHFVRRVYAAKYVEFARLFGQASQTNLDWSAWKADFAQYRGQPRKFACIVLVACLFADVVPNRSTIVVGYKAICGSQMDAKQVTMYKDLLEMKFGWNAGDPALTPAPTPDPTPAQAQASEPEPEPEPVVERLVVEPEPVAVEPESEPVDHAILSAVQDEVLNLGVRIEEMQRSLAEMKSLLDEKASRSELNAMDPFVTALVARVTRLEEVRPSEDEMEQDSLERMLRRLKAMGASVTITI